MAPFSGSFDEKGDDEWRDKLSAISIQGLVPWCGGGGGRHTKNEQQDPICHHSCLKQTPVVTNSIAAVTRRILLTIKNNPRRIEYHGVVSRRRSASLIWCTVPTPKLAEFPPPSVLSSHHSKTSRIILGSRVILTGSGVIWRFWPLPILPANPPVRPTNNQSSDTERRVFLGHDNEKPVLAC